MSDPSSSSPGPWTLVLPVKGGSGAKSRLRATTRLALAITLDTVEAVISSPAVGTAVVVSHDPTVRQAIGQLRGSAQVVLVEESHPGAGLNPAIGDGLRHAEGRTAVLLPDLPALRGTDLAAALNTIDRMLDDGAPMVVIPDADHTGSVVLAADSATQLSPQFGPGSAQAHQRAGARRLTDVAPGLRRDVDTHPDLDAAAVLGLGPRTRALMRGPHSQLFSLIGSTPGSRSEDRVSRQRSMPS